MTPILLVFNLLLFYTSVANSFLGDDRFIKKYAMMKVYESCFGQEVVKEVRKELKAAAAKCSGISPSAPAAFQVKVQPPQTEQLLGQRHKPQTQNLASNDKLVTVEHNSGVPQDMESGTHIPPLQIAEQNKPQGIDLNKLQQAILAGYNKQFNQQQIQPQHFAPTAHHQQFRPYYQPPAFNNLYYPQQNLFPQQPQYLPNPYYQPPVFPYQPFYRGQRGSRDLDVRGQLETLATRMSGKVRNVTCIMQELGYLDVNLEPDYSRMIERIGRLPVQEDLKKDMIEGVDFCRQFSQCLPEDRRDKLVREMVRPMFFFRCYKHKKLEACIVKDVRDRYTSSASDEMTEDNLTGGENRSAKEFPEDNMPTAIYEFLYGDEHVESDGLL